MKKSTSLKSASPQRQKLRVLYISAICLIIPMVALTPLLMYFGISNILGKAIAGDYTQAGVVVYESNMVFSENPVTKLSELPKTGSNLVLTSSPVLNLITKTDGCNLDTSGYLIVHNWQKKLPSENNFKTFANIGRNIGPVFDKNISLPTTESGLDSKYEYRVKWMVYRTDSKGSLNFVSSLTSDVFQPNINGYGFEGPVLNMFCQ